MAMLFHVGSTGCDALCKHPAQLHKVQNDAVQGSFVDKACDCHRVRSSTPGRVTKKKVLSYYCKFLWVNPSANSIQAYFKISYFNRIIIYFTQMMHVLYLCANLNITGILH